MAAKPNLEPWMIVAWCDANTHNSMRVATNPKRGPRCICPRALALNDEFNRERRERAQSAARAIELGRARQARMREQEIASGQTMRVARAGRAGRVFGESKSVRIPDLTGGACTTAYGYVIVDEARDTGNGGEKARIKLKALCQTCPLSVFKACEKWVLEAEYPVGSWGGVYAGMSTGDRIRRKANEQ